MNTSILLILLTIGIVAGILSGFVGIGGGIIIVPSLYFLAKLDWTTSTGTSLFVLVMPVVALGLMNYWKAGSVNVKYGLIIASTFVIGGFIGSRLSLRVNPNIVKIVFGFIMIFSAFMLIRNGIIDLKKDE